MVWTRRDPSCQMIFQKPRFNDIPIISGDDERQCHSHRALPTAAVLQFTVQVFWQHEPLNQSFKFLWQSINQVTINRSIFYIQPRISQHQEAKFWECNSLDLA